MFPSSSPTFAQWQQSSVRLNNRMIQAIKNLPPEKLEGREILDDEMVKVIHENALLCAATLAAKTMFAAQPDVHGTAAKIIDDLKIWTQAVQYNADPGPEGKR